MVIENFEFVRNEGCRVSDIIYKRAQGHDIALPGVSRLASGEDRMAFVNLLRSGGRQLCEKVGIPFVETQGVHDVTSGAAPHGDFFFCDMLASLHEFAVNTRVLDFGCSSGRVIRNLKSALPYIEAYGCDPRDSTIQFIAPRVPDVRFFTSNQAPPISEGEYEFDVVFAISVWSHFSEARAIEWFDEMARVIAPGGRLIFSTHGFRSIYHFAHIKGSMPSGRAAERLAALREGKFHFMRYGANDLDSHWGMAFIPPGWFNEKLTERWTVESFSPGLAMANQDVYVLARR